MQLFTHSLTSVAFNEKQNKTNKQTNKQKEEHVVCDPGYSIFVNGPYDNYHQ